MHSFQHLTFAQEEVRARQDALTESVAKAFPIGVTVVVVDGAGRRMPCVVKHHVTGRDAGDMRCMPVNNRGRARSMRTVHWTQIDPEDDEHA